MSVGRSVIQSPTPSTLTLASSTPFLPFIGNQLVLSSYVPNAGVVSAVTAAYGVGLARQPDCSLVENYLLPATTPSAGIIASLPAAQDYLHQLSGLATTADVFAKGCTDPELGLPSRFFGVVRTTNTTKAIVASAESGLVVSVADSTANTFTSNTLLSSTALTGYMAVADLNGDGFDDIVATFVTDPGTLQTSTAVLLGNGDGTFKPAVYYNVPGDVTIDDVNGDGKPDIVVLTNPGVTTLIGKGDGTFTIGAVSATSRTAYRQAPGQVLTGDFNGDGKKDLLTGGVVLLGAGDGTFTVGSPITTDPSLVGFLGSFPTAVGDLNKDGKLDVVSSGDGYIVIFYGNGDGTFRAGPRYASLPNSEPVAITDIDGDGNSDIVVGTSGPGQYTEGTRDTALEPLFQVLLGRGDGTFVGAAVYNQGTGNGSGYGPQIASADFNGDGKQDVLVANQNTNGGAPSSLVVLPGDGTGKMGTALTSSINLGPTMVAAADMNRDGRPDAVLAGSNFSASPQLSVLINQGNGTFAGEQDYSLPNYAVSLAVGDFNGDGRMDVAVGVAPSLGGSGPTGVYVLLGQANGTLGVPVKIDASLNPTGLAAGDLNGDGRTDLIVADQGFFNYVGGPQQVNGALHVYLGNANGTFTAAAPPPTSATNYSVAALGDLNGDGKLDLIVAGNVAGKSVGAGTPNLYTLLGNGDGTFKAASIEPLVGTDGIGANSIALADFNKDGHLDVVVGNSNDFTEVLLGQGNGKVAHTLLALGQRPGAVAAVDLNGDAFPELVVHVVDTNGAPNVAVFLNSGVWVAVATATTTTLTSSAVSLTAGQSLTLTSTVAAASGTTGPSGNVIFFDGSTTLGSVALDSTGKAVFTTSSLAAGSHTLSASYAGSTMFATSASSTVTVQVTSGAADFALGLSPAAGTATAGHSVQTILTLTPSNGFNQSVSLTCSGLPAGATCSFAPASVTINGSAATSMLTIATAAATASNSVKPPFDPLAPGGLLLTGIGLPIILRRRRALFRLSRYGWMALLLVGAATLLQGCWGDGGNGGGSSRGTPAGTSSITITATAGATTHTATYALTVN